MNDFVKLNSVSWQFETNARPVTLVLKSLRNSEASITSPRGPSLIFPTFISAKGMFGFLNPIKDAESLVEGGSHEKHLLRLLLPLLSCGI